MAALLLLLHPCHCSAAVGESLQQLPWQDVPLVAHPWWGHAARQALHYHQQQESACVLQMRSVGAVMAQAMEQMEMGQGMAWREVPQCQGWRPEGRGSAQAWRMLSRMQSGCCQQA